MTAAEHDGQVVPLHDQRALVRAAVLRKYPRRSWDGQSDGDRLVDHYGAELRFIADTGEWAYWTGQRWATEGASSEVLRRVRRTVDALPKTEALHYSPHPPGEEFDPLVVDPAVDTAEPAPKSQRAGFLNYVKSRRALAPHKAMIVEASGTGAVSVLREQFDQHAMLLSVANGVLDLSDRTLAPHRPDLLMMLGTPVAWEPDATCPTWRALLAKAIPGLGAREHLQRWLGYSATGRTDEHASAVHYGPAKDVRRAVFAVLREVFGTYAQAVPKSTLVERASDTSVPNDLARMVGRRLLLVPEPPRNASLAEETVKSITDGQAIPARHMRGEWFEFAPVGKLHLLVSRMPGLSVDSIDAAEGMQVIGWTEHIERAELAAMVDQIIERELPGVLAWIVAGCAAWQTHGLAAPKEVRETTEEALFHGSVLAQWVDARLSETAPTQWIELGVLYADYLRWVERRGEQPLPFTRLGSALEEQFGIQRKRGPATVNRRAVVFGVELRPDSAAKGDSAAAGPESGAGRVRVEG